MAISTPTTDSSAAFDTQELRAWRGMLRAHAALTKALDAELERTHGLALSSYEVLLHVSHADDQRMRMCDLADSVILSRSGLTRLIDRLEREGLVARESCPSDARGSFARLTPEGAEKLADARRTHIAGVRLRFLDRVTPDELDALGDVWDRVLAGDDVDAPALPPCS